MKPIPNFDNITPTADRERLAPGGYVLKITDVEDFPNKEYLRIIYDIAEGPEAGRYADEWGTEHPYAHAYLRSYKAEEWIVRRFKAFINAVEASNEGFKWAWNESKLEGLIFGAVLALEEYENDRGEVKTRLYIPAVMSAERIRTGDYTVPDIKKLPRDTMKPAGDVAFGDPITDEQIPF